MASPPQIQRSAVLLRTPQEFKDLRDVNKWAKDLLFALELQNPQEGIGVHQGTNISNPTTYPYTAQSSDYIILVDTRAAPRTIALPAMTRGYVVSLVDVYGNAGANPITINPHGAETINGALTLVLSSDYARATVLGTGIAGQEWVRIA